MRDIKFKKAMAVFQVKGEMHTNAKPLTAAILGKISAASPSLASDIHDGRDGYMYGKRIYKPLTHSQLFGQVWDSDRQVFVFPGGHAILYVGWREDVVDAFSNGLKSNPVLCLGDTFTARLVTIADIPLVDSVTDVFMPCGPIVARHNGKYVVQRDDPQMFINMLRDNLVRKHTAIKGCPPSAPLSINVPGKMQTVPLRWGSFSVIGNRGNIRIKGDPDFMRIVMAVGIGKYNSIGCGMLLPA